MIGQKHNPAAIQQQRLQHARMLARIEEHLRQLRAKRRKRQQEQARADRTRALLLAKNRGRRPIAPKKAKTS